LISWHLFHQNAYFTLMLTKKHQLLAPATMALPVEPAGGLAKLRAPDPMLSPNHGDRSTTMDEQLININDGPLAPGDPCPCGVLLYARA